MFRSTLVTSLLMLLLTVGASAQARSTPASPVGTAGIKVTQIDLKGLKKILKPAGRPLLINFWATWCPPCTEEFPDLVQMHSDFRRQVDFVTVSLDELSEIDNDVPKFLENMHSEMPAYLLHTPNENAAISLVSRDWRGNLPMTVLYDSSGKQVYARMGKIKAEILRENIRKLLPPSEAKPPASTPAN